MVIDVDRAPRVGATHELASDALPEQQWHACGYLTVEIDAPLREILWEPGRVPIAVIWTHLVGQRRYDAYAWCWAQLCAQAGALDSCVQRIHRTVTTTIQFVVVAILAGAGLLVEYADAVPWLPF